MDINIKELIAEYESTTAHRVRWRLLDVLFHLHDRRMVPDLIEALATPDDHVRAIIVLVLGQMGDEQAVEPLIGILARKKYGTARGNVGGAAVHALAQIGDARAIPVLIAALNHPLTQYEAVAALRKFGAVEAVPELIAAMRKDKNPSAATALGNFRDLRAVEPLIEELKAVQQPQLPQHLDKSQRWDGVYFYYIVRALGNLGDKRALPILEWVREYQTVSVLKGKSLSDMATRAIQRILDHSGPGEPN